MRIILTCVITTISTPGLQAAARQQAPLRLAIAGLVHGHVGGSLRGAQGRQDVQIVGVFDPDRTLLDGYAQYSFPTAFCSPIWARCSKTNPEAVASSPIPPTIRGSSASRRMHVMMEKPLASAMPTRSASSARREKGGIQVLVNFETTWYPSHGSMWSLIKERGELGEIRERVAMDGYSGPKAIKVQAEFLDWLRDPVRNGAGALYDFGCYETDDVDDGQSAAARRNRNDAAVPAGNLSEGG